MNFNELGLSPELLQAITDTGYTTPTPIQEQAIPVVAQGRDVLGCAQTGTGKTASFALPMIDKLAAGRARARMPRSLILEPTRELATQVEASFERYGKHHRLSTALLIGGESFGDQEKKLDRGVDVLIATPGRLLDLFERGKVLLSDVRILVIDEADRMLDMGFIPDVERIVGLLPRARQTLFFSATMPPEIRRLADAFLNSPVEIAVAPPASPAETVAQSLVVVTPEQKREVLRRLIGSEDVKNALIFCNRKRDVDILQRSLARHGFDAAALHGDMPQPKRTETLERFKNSEIRLLVASDVAARGLDIQGLSHVFCFDVPYHAEDYVHRIGRTGRAGRQGRSFMLAAPEDGKAVAAIQKLIGKEIPVARIDDFAAAELDYEGGERRRGRYRAAPKERARPNGYDGHKGRVNGHAAAQRNGRGDRHPSRRERPAHAEPRRDAAPAVVNFPRQPQEPRRKPQPERRPATPERQIVGFGDDLPAFLARAPRIIAEA
ncbi:MAG: DEAD/DEAH box helicase [Alphaproteobacteria bacterium]|nr:DEAD/DEAH box helicase [Alphaproteobacteria bacterium]MBV9154420.1 DEAD/DEAH box helicase [Alphaproteobacteria bacterium]MBV9584609.1 DEAD/DEAH box helicase [Alphaproteobacteria bacterium]MBV9966858.1 DEAD/DEAH box helicase [Alphaproteobacteria bacterium]